MAPPLDPEIPQAVHTECEAIINRDRAFSHKLGECVNLTNEGILTHLKQNPLEPEGLKS